MSINELAPIDTGFYMAPTAALYIDADNQSHRLAAPLVRLVEQKIGAGITQVTVAGNGHGQVNQRWLKALTPLVNSATEINSIVVPLRPDGADMALVVALSCRLTTHVASGTTIVIVSHDIWLEKLAHYAIDLGADAHLVFSTHQRARETEVPLWVITPEYGPQPYAPEPADKRRKGPPPSQRVARAAAYIREHCRATKHGAYHRGAVHQALLRLGHTKRSRRNALIKRLPGLRECTVDGSQVIFFDRADRLGQCAESV